jgi:hypothetical protein
MKRCGDLTMAAESKRERISSSRIGAAVALPILLASCAPKVLVAVDPSGQVRPAHRYSFNGVGTLAVDSIGTADGEIVGAQLAGSGRLTLSGGTNATAPYVTLPHGLLRELHDATFEAWVNWAGPVASDGTGSPWQRVFDFGEGATGVAGEQASGGVTARSYLFLTPQTAPRSAAEMPATRVAFQVPHDQQSVDLEVVVNTSPLPVGVDAHVGVVIDASNHKMSLFVNGIIAGAVDLTQDDPLSYVYDINDWLGRSQFAQDDGFSGSFLEFRIYDVALTPAQVQVSYAAGPDAALRPAGT